jgi:hypothetical protein
MRIGSTQSTVKIPFLLLASLILRKSTVAIEEPHHVYNRYTRSCSSGIGEFLETFESGFNITQLIFVVG